MGWGGARTAGTAGRTAVSRKGALAWTSATANREDASRGLIEIDPPWRFSHTLHGSWSRDNVRVTTRKVAARQTDLPRPVVSTTSGGSPDCRSDPTRPS